MSDFEYCEECGEEYSLEEHDSCPNCFADETVICEECGTEYLLEEGECPYCAEWEVPEGTECEFCDNPAVAYVQDHPVCQDHYDDAYPID